MGKNIIIFSDGTGQKGGIRSNTNVYKLFNMVEDRTDRQIVCYDPGLGTDWKKVTGSLFGRGFSKNLLDCYRFIFEQFEASDRIFLFGFSRGAATVRSLSAFIHLFGILPRSRPDLIQQACSAEPAMPAIPINPRTRPGSWEKGMNRISSSENDHALLLLRCTMA